MALPGRPISPRPEFDDAKLMSMQEPLSVRVERMKDGKRSNIPLWESANGQPNGQGWTKDEVRDLEQRLVTWSGGGYYRLSVTDSTADTPIVMKWESNIDRALYQELVPPPLQDAASQEASVGSIPQPLQGPRMPPFSPPFPFPGHQQQQPYGYSAPMPPPPPFGSQHYASYQQEAEKREREAENRRLREDNERRDREARDREHKADLERERAANNQRFADMAKSISDLGASFKDALRDLATPKGPSDEMLELRRQLAEQREATRRAEERAEASRREDQLKELIRQQGEQSQRLFEAAQRQIDAMQAQTREMIANLTSQMASNTNKQDPLISLMLENARTHADALKAIAAENRQAIEKVQAFVMQPRELLALARESAESAEKAGNRATEQAQKVMDLHQRVIETALQTAPGGTTVTDVVAQGITGVQSAVERLFGAKAKAEIATAQANAQVAQAQVAAMEIDARMRNPAAFATPLPAASSAGLGQAQPQAPATPEEPPQAAQPTSGEPTRKPADRERLWGRTDLEWFGPALGAVLTVRAGVAEFIKVGQEAHDRGVSIDSLEEIPGESPKSVALNVFAAVSQANAANVAIPAITDLLLPGQVDLFVGVLLPDATSEFRQMVVEFLKDPAKLEGSPEEDEDEDEEDEDEPNDQTRAPQPLTNGEAQPKTRAKAGQSKRGGARA